MRILFLDQFPTLGGGQRILVDVAESFAADGHEVTVGLPPPGDGPAEVAGELERRGISHVEFSLPKLTAGSKGLKDALLLSLSTASLRRQLRSLVAAKKIDLIYVNGPRWLPAAVLAGKPVIAAIHLIHKGMERRLLESCFNRPNVKLVTFCSRFAAAPFQTPKALIVPNWVSPAILDAPNVREAMRASLKLEPDQVAVGVLGRISPNKGQAFLIEALAPILGPGLRLFVAGTPDHEAPSPLPSNPFVTELGKVDPAPFLDAMDILVVPTLVEEAFGLTAAEAMARGLSVVATRSGGLSEIVVHGETGFLTEKSASEISDAVATLARDVDKRHKMGEAGHKRISETYTVATRLPEIKTEIERRLS